MTALICYQNIEKERAKNFSELLLIYYTNFPNNQFQDHWINTFPRWSKPNKEDYDFAIQLLSKKIVKISKENVRNYAHLAWLHTSLPKSLQTYEMTLQYVFFNLHRILTLKYRFFYFSVTCFKCPFKKIPNFTTFKNIEVP